MRSILPLETQGSVHRLRVRAALGLLGLALTTVMAAAAAPAAHAEFSEALKQPCTGSAIGGEGSSAQKVAQEQIWPNTFAQFCEDQGKTAPHVTYDPDGSGCGLISMGAGGVQEGCSFGKEAQKEPGSRNALTRFGGSDAPPTQLQRSNMESSGGSHPGVVHVLPVATFAVAVIVHFPEGCELEEPGGGGNADTTTGSSNDPSGKSTGDTAAAGTLRVHIEAKTLEEIWEGKVVTWGQVLTREGSAAVHMKDNGEDTPSNALESEEHIEHCSEVPVRRIVREDGSGTTFNFKSYLGLLPGAPAGLWTSAPVQGTNTTWPISFGGEKTVPPEAASNNECTHAVSSHLICTARENGGGGVAKVVEATDGSIAYLDLATAHQKGFTITPKALNGEKLDDTYWVPLQTINPSTHTVGANYVEPSENPKLNLSTETEFPGANCTNADYREFPTAEASPGGDPTLGDWENAIGTGSLDEKTYPACGLTYDFAFDDLAPVYGNNPTVEAEARTVKDYLTAVTSVQGQTEILGANYGKLSTLLAEDSRKGVAAINWNGTGSSGPPGCTTGECTKTTTTTTTTSSTGTATLPSNSFSVAGSKVKNKHIVLSLVLPGAGHIKVTAKGDGVSVSSLNSAVTGGQGSIELPISKAAQKKLGKVRGGKFKVTITVTFTPTGGSPATHTVTITLTKASLAKGKSKGGKKRKKK